MSSVIEIKDLSFSYNDTKPVLQIPHLAFTKSETVFLFGASGSGKTTLLEILAGVITGQKGEVEMLGQKTQHMSLTARDQFRSKHIGYIFQQFNLIPYLSVRENILLPFTFSGKKLNQALYDRVIGELGLTVYVDQLATELSVGQQQRVAAARALVIEPDIILADEPTSALDYDHRENFLKILFSLVKSQGSTLIFVSHDRSIQNLFDRHLNLSDINVVRN
ncbi:methionine ABC transporter ATP-binding protein [Bdellovibrio sp. qaytius]|nr:methionine ABC transporter ATP-binding protein [Bdellovibrio sp. qaytius]